MQRLALMHCAAGAIPERLTFLKGAHSVGARVVIVADVEGDRWMICSDRKFLRSWANTAP